jgi:hypothetical protein
MSAPNQGERYLDVFQRWMTPEEMDQLRKDLGPPEIIRERTRRTEQLIERAERKEVLWQFFKAALVAFASLVAVLATIKALVPGEWWN